MVYGYSADNELAQLWIVKGPTGESENYKKGDFWEAVGSGLKREK